MTNNLGGFLSPGGYTAFGGTPKTDNSDIDPDTGLPKLEDGYYWQIARLPFHWNLVVQLRKRRWLFPGKVLRESATGPHERDIRDNARRLLESYQGSREYEELTKRLIGKYPPKKLNKENN